MKFLITLLFPELIFVLLLKLVIIWFAKFNSFFTLSYSFFKLFIFNFNCSFSFLYILKLFNICLYSKIILLFGVLLILLVLLLVCWSVFEFVELLFMKSL